MTDGPVDPLSEGPPSTALVETTRDDDVAPGLAADLLSSRDPARTNLVTVLYDVSPDEWMTAWLRRIGTRPADLRMVSVGDRTRSAAGKARRSGAAGVGAAGTRIRVVEDPGNVTELGITTSECLTDDGDGERTVLYFDSVSALLQWTDLEHAAQFLEVLTGRLRAKGHSGVFLVRPEAHDEGTLRALGSIFDTVVSAGEGSVPDGADDPTDAVLDVLSDPTRRDALRVLFGERRLTVEQLAERIARGAGRETAGSVGSTEELATELYHWHLPQLKNAGFVEYDPDAGEVELADSADRIRPYLRIAQRE